MNKMRKLSRKKTMKNISARAIKIKLRFFAKKKEKLLLLTNSYENCENKCSRDVKLFHVEVNEFFLNRRRRMSRKNL